MNYNFEIEKIIKEIKKAKAKRVLLQLPEGLKPFATKLVDEIESNTNVRAFIWIGSCYGSCDLPQGIEKLKIDTVMHLGHSAWPFYKAKEI
ncbi:MAG: diphthamide synthesis protein [Candidatus Pacearchaeota archaeon]|nr:diphthamide synthesis protein [Candidatus Pacearchaeota archaeon]